MAGREVCSVIRMHTVIAIENFLNEHLLKRHGARLLEGVTLLGGVGLLNGSKY